MIRTARQLQALETRVGLLVQADAQVGVGTVGSVVYELQNGTALETYLLSLKARRQLSAAQSRLSNLRSSGAGVGSGIAIATCRESKTGITLKRYIIVEGGLLQYQSYDCEVIIKTSLRRRRSTYRRI
jgi:hypothetical protein